MMGKMQFSMKKWTNQTEEILFLVTNSINTTGFQLLSMPSCQNEGTTYGTAVPASLFFPLCTKSYITTEKGVLPFFSVTSSTICSGAQGTLLTSARAAGSRVLQDANEETKGPSQSNLFASRLTEVNNISTLKSSQVAYVNMLHLLIQPALPAPISSVSCRKLHYLVTTPIPLSILLVGGMGLSRCYRSLPISAQEPRRRHPTSQSDHEEVLDQSIFCLLKPGYQPHPT